MTAKKPSPKPHGGARPGAGRKALDDVKPTTKYLIAMTADQREKIEANGGAPWVRKLIDEAPTAIEKKSAERVLKDVLLKGTSITREHFDLGGHDNLAKARGQHAVQLAEMTKNLAARQRLDRVKLKIQPDPEGLKGREIEGIKSAKAVAKRLKKILPKKP